MKNLLLALTLLFSAATFAKDAEIKPNVSSAPFTNPAVTQPILDSVSGDWYAIFPFGLELNILAGDYQATLNGYIGCGKFVDVSAAIPRNAPFNGSFFGRGAAFSPTGYIQMGTSINLLPPGKGGIYGTITFVDYSENGLVVDLVTPYAGPTGRYTLRRKPITGSTAVIVYNPVVGCQ